MAKGIPVSYNEYGWATILFRILGAIALLGGGALAMGGGRDVFGLGIGIAVVGAIILAFNEFAAARRRAAERSAIDTGSGLRWLGGPVDVEYQDEDIVAVRLKHARKYSAGILKAIVRRFEVWIANNDRPLCMVNRLGVNGNDPLGPMIQRIIDGLKARTAEGLASGAVLEGDTWRLAAMQLIVTEGRQTTTVPFAEIDKVAIFDDKWCVWQRGRAEPAVKIAPDSKNAPVLAALLGEWMELRKDAADEAVAEAPADGLGRLLFERRNNSGLWVGLLFAILGGIAGTVLLFQRGTPPIGALVLGVAAVSAALGLLFGRYVFRCYERGLVRRRGSSELRMPYTDIVQFDYSATRMFHNGAYTGTAFSLSFRSPGATIRYSTQIPNPDSDLDELRDHIAKVVAGRMFCQLRDGQPVAWGTDMVFLPQGLQFRRSKMFGLSSGPAEVLPYDRILGSNIEKGVFYLFSKGEPKPVLSKQASAANFFPGFFLLLTLQNKPGEEPAEAEVE
jgi:hypothetical protein